MVTVPESVMYAIAEDTATDENPENVSVLNTSGPGLVLAAVTLPVVEDG
jgi:hypothetical protein